MTVQRRINVVGVAWQPAAIAIKLHCLEKEIVDQLNKANFSLQRNKTNSFMYALVLWWYTESGRLVRVFMLHLVSN